MKKPYLVIIVVIFIFSIFPRPCHAELIAEALKLDQIVKESDVIIKAKVISSKVVKDSWFEYYDGFNVLATEMELISAIKGEIPSGKIIFKHYGPLEDKKGHFIRWSGPQLYDLEKGKTYIIFAQKNGSEKAAFRQIWKYHTAKQDQGAFLSADDEPISKDKTVKQIIWDELNKLLKSTNPKDVAYAINELDVMSRPAGWDKLDDFDRSAAIQAIHAFVLNKDDKVATFAISAMGWASPYMSDYEADRWLSSIGEGKIPGYSEWDKDRKNTSAHAYWADLVSVVNGNGTVENRASAILALGLAGEPKIFEYAVIWSNNKEPLIRQAATILLSDFPNEKSAQLIIKSSQDENPHVRLGAARAIGFGRFDKLIPILEGLLKDKDINVANAAYISLLSFDLNKVKDIFKKYKDDPDWKALVVNPLAQENPEPYINDLAEIVEKKMDSKYFRGGATPSFMSWKILFGYLLDQSDERIRSGDYDRYFDALENVKSFGSSEPRDLYAFYIHHGLTKRAKSFREHCKKTMKFDMDYYFDMVDKNKNYFTNNSIYSSYHVASRTNKKS